MTKGLFFGLLLAFLACWACAQHKRVYLDTTEDVTTVEKDRFVYYELRDLVELKDGESLNIISTQISGDVDLYVSNSSAVQYPDQNRYTWKDSEPGSCLVSLARPGMRGPFWIGVFGSGGTAKFTLSVFKASRLAEPTRTNRKVLVAGVPQYDYLEPNQDAFYKFYYKDDGFLTISVSTVTGDADLFVSTKTEFPSALNATWSQTAYGTDVLRIKARSHADWVGDGWYYISVQPKDHDTAAEYVITVSTKQTVIQLGEGIPLSNIGTSGEYVYFKYDLVNRHTLFWKVTPLGYGDPDIYISAIHQRPNRTHYTWVGSRFGADTVEIVNGTKDFVCCPNSYFAAIYVFYSCSFTITAKQASTHTVLQTGRPLYDTIGKRRWTHYVYYHRPAEANNRVDIAVVPTYGWVGIVASTSVKYPDFNNRDFVGNFTEGRSRVIHTSNYWNFPLTYYIGVYAFTDEGAGVYVSAVNSENFMRLLDGRVYPGLVAGTNDVKWFLLEARPVDDVTINVRAINGRVMTYVSPNDTVSNSKYAWEPIDSTGSMIILKGDPNRSRRLVGGDADLVPEQFYVGVYPTTNDASFTINFYTNNQTIELYAGMPEQGYVPASRINYYRFYATSATEVTFRAMGSGGRSRVTLYTGVGTNKRPSRFQYDRISQGSAVEQTIRYETVTPNSYYYIGVEGEIDSYYTLTATTGIAILDPVGVSYSDEVKKGAYKYYRLSLNNWSKYLFVGTTLINGGVELYMLRNMSRPSRDCFHYGDKDHWPGKFLFVDPDDFNDNDWTVAVYGVVDSHYLVHASLVDDQYIFQNELREGIPYTLGLRNQRPTYLKVDWSYTTKSLMLHMRPIRKEWFVWYNVYASQDNMYPNATTATWQASADRDIILTLNGTRPYEDVYVSVVFEGIYDAATHVVMTLQTQDSPFYLTQETLQEQIVDPKQRRFFEVAAVHDSDYITAVVMSCDDRKPPTLYGSDRTRKPDENNKRWESSVFGNFTNVLTGTSTDEGSMYYVGTSANPSPTDSQRFNIYVTTLHDFRPLPRENGVIILRGRKSSTHYTLSIPTATGNGPFRYYVYKYELAEKETLENKNFESECAVRENGDWVGEIEVPEFPPNPTRINFEFEVRPQKRYAVNVIVEDRFYIANTYRPTYINVGELVDLRLGRSMMSVVGKGNFVNFMVQPGLVNLRSNNTFAIILTPFSGDPDLYMARNKFPNEDEYDWNSRHVGADLIRINITDPKYAPGQKYFISVYGADEYSEFTIMAYVTDEYVVLEDGRPQLLQIARKENQYMRFALDSNDTFVISGTPLYGDPDLWADTRGPKPDPDTSPWHSGAMGYDLIEIRKFDRNFVFKPPYTVYYIGANGFSESLFSIVATKEFSSQILLEAIPTVRRLTPYRNNVFFKYNLVQKEEVWMLVGLLDNYMMARICISVNDTNKQPDEECDWEEYVGWEDVKIVIETTDPKFRVGWYYIGVSGFQIDDEIRFQITAQSARSATLLVDNMPVEMYAEAQEENYFKMQYGYSQLTMTFTVTMFDDGGANKNNNNNNNNNNNIKNVAGKEGSGWCDMYIAYGYAPTRDKYDFKGEHIGNQIVYSISDSDNVGMYFVLIYSYWATNYTMMGQRNQRPSKLLLGTVNPSGEVPAGMWKYYYFEVAERIEKKSLFFSAGSREWLEIYADTYPQPDENNYSWKAERWQRTMTIPKADLDALNPYSTIYFAIIDRYMKTRYNALLYEEGSIVTLQEDTPMPGTAAPKSYSEYVLKLRNSGRLKFTLKHPMNREVVFYCKEGERASEQNKDYISDLRYGLNVIDIYYGDAGTSYYIAVKGTNITGSYVITANTEYEDVTDGDTVLDYVEQGKYRKFRAYITEAEFKKRMTIAATLVSGSIEVYAHPNDTLPSRESFTYKSQEARTNVIKITDDDANFKYGVWSFAVYGVTNSEFLFSLFTMFGDLKSGTPRAGRTTEEFPSYFVYMNNAGFNTTTNIFVKVFESVCVDVFVATRTFFPNATTAEWTARTDTNTYQAFLSIDYFSRRWGGAFFIAVVPCYPVFGDGFRFEISATSGTAREIFINQNLPLVYESKSGGRMHNFALKTSHFANRVSVYAENCQKESVHQEVRIFAANASYQYPITANNSQYESDYDGVFKEKLYIDNVDTDAIYRIGIQSVRRQPTGPTAYYSLYATTEATDPRPLCPYFTGVADEYYDDSLHYTFTVGKIMRGRYPMTLQFAYIRNEDYTKSDGNFDTFCGVSRNMEAYMLYSVRIDSPQVTQFELIQLRSTTSRVNVIIEDALGLQSACMSKTLRPDYYRPVMSIRFSVGAALMIAATLLLMAYAIVGMVVKRIKYKSRGLELIPHKAFLFDLPFLVKDGIVALFTCFRRRNTAQVSVINATTTTSTATKEEESAVNEENPFKEEEKKLTADVGTYGTI